MIYNLGQPSKETVSKKLTILDLLNSTIPSDNAPIKEKPLGEYVGADDKRILGDSSPITKEFERRLSFEESQELRADTEMILRENLTNEQIQQSSKAIIKNLEALSKGSLQEKDLAKFHIIVDVLRDTHRDNYERNLLVFLAEMAADISYATGLLERVLPPNGPIGKGHYPDKAISLVRKKEIIQEKVKYSQLWIRNIEEDYPDFTDVQHLKEIHNQILVNRIEPQRPKIRE